MSRLLRDPSLGVPLDLPADELAAIREDAATWREQMADESLSRTGRRMPRRFYRVDARCSLGVRQETMRHYRTTGETEIPFEAMTPRLRRLLALKCRMIEHYGRK